jgi:hypothetical protein
MTGAGENLTAGYDGYAIYLPSMQRSYASFPMRNLGEAAQAGLPRGFERDDLNFLNSNNRLWHCKYALYSAGQFEKASVSSPDIVTNRNADTVIVGDSGGFQIGTGNFPAVKSWSKERNNPSLIYQKWMRERSIRDTVLRWLDRYCDYAMTLDMPLWLLNDPKSKGSPFANLSAEQLIELSVENLRYFANKRGAATGAKAKYLNVLQDAGGGTGEAWYQAVKDFDFEGWALAGSTKDGLETILQWVRRLLNDGKLDRAEWLHVLMASPPVNAVYLTAIQRRLRALLGTNITISYDSSSPFQSAGIRQEIAELPHLTSDIQSWRIKRSPFPQSPIYQNKAEHQYLTENPSPVTKKFSINDLHSDRGDFAQTFLSDAGVHLLTNHNVYIFHKLAIQACDLVFSDTLRDEARIPREIQKNVDHINEYLA